MKLKNLLIGLGAVGTIITAGIMTELTCLFDDVRLTVSQEKSCMSDEDYQNIKTNLKNEYYDLSKDYDFDINNRNLLFAVLNKEIKGKEFTFKNTDELKKQLIDLLSN